MAHVLFSPSVLARRLACLGSANAEKDLPDTTSKYADEGSAAHALAAWALLENGSAASRIGEHVDLDGALWEITEDMATAVDHYVDAIREHHAALGGDLHVEVEVDYAEWMPAGVEGKGTSDAILASDGKLEVHDYKHGRGVRVDAVDNPQLLAYALGAHAKYGLLYDYDTIELWIHQPRLNWESSWEINVAMLEEWAATLRSAIEQALAPDAPRTPGEKQCRFCKAMATCPALVAHNARLMVEDFDDLDTLPVPPKEPLSAVRLEQVLDKIDLFEAWLKRVREQAVDQLQRGVELPGWKLVEGRRGNRNWQDPAAVEETLKAMRLKRDEMYSIELISPAQAEKLLKDTPRRWARVETLITQAPGKPTLARATDKRPAIQPVVDQFSDLTGAAAPEAYAWQR
jgi:hypothetical protein